MNCEILNSYTSECLCLNPSNYHVQQTKQRKCPHLKTMGKTMKQTAIEH